MAPQPLSLKQRLANLQQSISSPPSPTTPTNGGSSGAGRAFGALGAALGKRKASFTRSSPNLGTGSGGFHEVDDVISRMIFQAGVDYE